MVFIEAPIFTRLVGDYLDDDAYRDLQWYLVAHPESGDIIKGSGGVRKIRWASGGKGKSGGVRAIYYWKKANSEIWMLTIYSKRDRSTIQGHVLKQIAAEIDDE